MNFVSAGILKCTLYGLLSLCQFYIILVKQSVMLQNCMGHIVGNWANTPVAFDFVPFSQTRIRFSRHLFIFGLNFTSDKLV